MINIRSEGQLVRQGLNFYPLTDDGSIGFVLRIGNKTLCCRYSKIAKRMMISRI